MRRVRRHCRVRERRVKAHCGVREHCGLREGRVRRLRARKLSSRDRECCLRVFNEWAWTASGHFLCAMPRAREMARNESPWPCRLSDSQTKCQLKGLGQVSGSFGPCHFSGSRHFYPVSFPQGAPRLSPGRMHIIERPTVGQLLPAEVNRLIHRRDNWSQRPTRRCPSASSNQSRDAQQPIRRPTRRLPSAVP